MPQLAPDPDAFCVEELPRFTPTGQGRYQWLWLEKENLHTDTLLRIVSEAANCPRRAIGFAGRKDKLSLSRQWLSLPADCSVSLPPSGDEYGGRWSLLDQEQHDYPLRLGQLQGNRFALRLQDADTQQLQAALDELQQTPLINYFGAQRFGHQQQNLQAVLACSNGDWQAALDILLADDHGERGMMRSLRKARQRHDDPQMVFQRIDKRLRQYLASVAQSHVFNAVARSRVEAGLLSTLRTGDLLLRQGKSAFHVREDEREQLQQELEAGAVATTAPLPGFKVRRPDDAIDAQEQQWSAGAGIDWQLFDRGALFASPGERRRIQLQFLEKPVFDAQQQTLRFALPAGSFATVLMGALGITDPRRSAES